MGNVVSREYEVLNLLLGVPNVIQMNDFFYSMDSKHRIIQNTVLEFCDCSLEDQLRKVERTKIPMPIKIVKHFVRQIFKGLAGMHQLKIAHRDLKPENILLKSKSSSDPKASIDKESVNALDLEVKICDVGSSKVLDFEKRMNTPYVVSRYYRAPELIMGSNLYDLSIDIWAAGCILFELVSRQPLFPGEHEGLQLLE